MQTSSTLSIANQYTWT